MKMEKRITKIEKDWAMHKYSVLAKSHVIYLEIRELLKDKTKDISKNYFDLIQKAYSISDHIGEMTNAYNHVFGYFKKVVTTSEKQTFLDLVDLFSKNQIKDSEVKEFLYQLTKKYNSKYLLESYYFNENENVK
jgi:UV DNA damage endonuclease